jgi:fumarate reductase subunit D
MALFVLISLFMFHGCHRLLHSLHDLGLPRGRWAPWLFYGSALLATLAAAVLLGSMGG